MSEKLKIIVWDVQHGNAIYVNTPGNKDFVIDLGTGSCGNNDWEFSPLLHLKKHWNVPYLDGVIITHPHSDHIDDILNFDKLNPRVIRRPKHLTEEKGTDIFVAPHHGRQSGFSKELFEHISSRLTIISDGPSDTTASDKYSDKSRGWTVHKRNGGKEKRNCVTTRKDGVIEVDFGNNTDGKPYIQVTVD